MNYIQIKYFWMYSEECALLGLLINIVFVKFKIIWIRKYVYKKEQKMCSDTNYCHLWHLASCLIRIFNLVLTWSQFMICVDSKCFVRHNVCHYFSLPGGIWGSLNIITQLHLPVKVMPHSQMHWTNSMLSLRCRTI